MFAAGPIEATTLVRRSVVVIMTATFTIPVIAPVFLLLLLFFLRIVVIPVIPVMPVVA